MKIRIIAIGKQKKSPEKELVDYYVKLCKWDVEIVEIEIRNFSSIPNRKELEAKEIVKHTEGYLIIPLEEKGWQPDSPEFAKWLEDIQDNGKNVCFLIGGADGLDASISSSAYKTLSFGRMTLPHMLTRTVLAEQLYRAGTITENHPYHK